MPDTGSSLKESAPQSMLGTPQVPEYMREWYDTVLAAQARAMGLPYRAGSEPASKPDAATPVDAQVAHLTALLEAQTRLMATAWEAWFTMPVRFWQSLMNQQRKE